MMGDFFYQNALWKFPSIGLDVPTKLSGLNIHSFVYILNDLRAIVCSYYIQFSRVNICPDTKFCTFVFRFTTRVITAGLILAAWTTWIFIMNSTKNETKKLNIPHNTVKKTHTSRNSFIPKSQCRWSTATRSLCKRIKFTKMLKFSKLHKLIFYII